MRALGVTLVGLALLAGCGGGGSDEARSNMVAAPLPESRPKPAPNVEGMTLEGERVALSDFRGRPLIVNVWSSW